jgi:hypothetical protein
MRVTHCKRRPNEKPSRPWNQQEKQYLEFHFGKLAMKHMAVYLDRSIRGVEQQAAKMGFVKYKRTRFTSEEIAYVEANIGIVSIVKMAKHLGRTTAALHMFIYRQGYNQPMYKDAA